MPRYFRIVVADEHSLTDALHAFVTDPHPSRNQRPVIAEVHDFAPDMVPVLEHMVMDGVRERQDVAAYIQALFGQGRESLN